MPGTHHSSARHAQQADSAAPGSIPKTRWAWAVATFFGVGYLKPGPGTYGSVAAVLLWFGFAHIVPLPPALLTLCTLAVAILVTLVGIPAASRVAREAGREDPGFVVIDEVAGQLFALALTPGRGPHAWMFAVLALLLFRAFDITKPGPVRRLEQLPEGTGIMMDDVAAGLLSLLVSAILLSVLHPGR